jgi:DnaJ-class molecular chaperone
MCPTCNGTGIVPTQEWNGVASAKGPYARAQKPCSACHGTGQVPASAAEIETDRM